ncbi:hypothetical protein SAMN05444169_8064 [Bradyrhizobium erythrophlei]|uniref:Uncharacterized protein n=1 Tax=Bradyrhizobium erythrophlei TaxID=1437360 RepID=A0A1M5TYH8_9BRAD|nr:hypothetical protein SAMN05444169_8064 [Bradyrhizobium erythrophlei]
MAAAFRDVEAATLTLDGSPPITRTTFPTCRAHYPGGSSGCACRLLPRSYSLPQMAGGSASALSLSRPAQASLTLRPAGLLNRLKAAFVTRLQPCRLPGRTARQLPDQSTTLWVESSSTSDPRLRGALPKTDVDGCKMWTPLPHSHLRNRAGLQWPGPGRPLGLGQSDRRLFGLFGSTKSCLKMKSPLGKTIVGGIFRTSLIGVDFVSAVCAKAIDGPAKAQATISIIALFIVPILVQTIEASCPSTG